MKKFLLAIVMVISVSVANASNYNASVPGWDDLSGTEQAEIKLSAAKAKEAKLATPVSPDDVQKWINVGKSVGVGFGAAAKEIGVGVDELMKSDTGKIAMFLIVWNYVGAQFIGLISGLLWFAIFIPLWLKMFTRYGTTPTYEKNEDGEIIKTNYSVKSDEAVTYFSILGLIIIIVGFIIIF